MAGEEEEEGERGRRWGGWRGPLGSRRGAGGCWEEGARGSEVASAIFFFFLNLIGVHPCRGAGERRAERKH